MILLSAVFLSSFLQIAESVLDCQAHRELQRSEGNSGAPGYYEFDCDDQDANKYKPQQCWGSTGYCWCVDKYGTTIPDSQTNPGQTTVDCDTFGWCKSAKQRLTEDDDTMPPIGAYNPACDDNGNFAKTQQWGSTGERWCAVENGNKVPGTQTFPGLSDKSWDCENLPACLAEEASLAHLQVQDGLFPFGLDRPDCDEDGNYEPVQCHGSTGYCWCVDTGTGSERDDTRRGPGQDRVDCAPSDDKLLFNAATATPCQKLANKQREYLQEDENPPPGFSSVKCLEDGSYAPMQCHPSTDHCWCVDIYGIEIPGSLSKPGAPKTLCEKPPTCAEHKARIAKEMLIGRFIPDCDEDDNYKSKQCWGSTGECWCVTKDGNAIPSTRRGPTEQSDSLVCPVHPPPSSLASNLKSGSAEEGSVSGGRSTTPLIVVIAILACLLVVVLLGGVVFFKRSNRNSAQYTEVNTESNAAL